MRQQAWSILLISQRNRIYNCLSRSVNEIIHFACCWHFKQKKKKKKTTPPPFSLSLSLSVWMIPLHLKIKPQPKFSGSARCAVPLSNLRGTRIERWQSRDSGHVCGFFHMENTAGILRHLGMFIVFIIFPASFMHTDISLFLCAFHSLFLFLYTSVSVSTDLSSSTALVALWLRHPLRVHYA